MSTPDDAKVIANSIKWIMISRTIIQDLKMSPLDYVTALVLELTEVCKMQDDPIVKTESIIRALQKSIDLMKARGVTDNPVSLGTEINDEKIEEFVASVMRKANGV